jgi:membrane protease YdiL (CAAX protease family)
MLSKDDVGRIVIAVLIGVVILLISDVLSALLKGIHPPSVITHSSMLILSVLTITILGKGRFSEYGFHKAQNVRWVRSTLIALALGASGTCIILLSGASGMPMMEQLSFPQVILFVWLLASIAEEVLTRGVIQSYLSPLNEAEVKLLMLKVNIPTLISALFFSAMHITVITSGADIPTTIIVVVYAFFLGLLAGHIRAQSQSLVPAIAVHILFNIGGVVGGILFTILTTFITGKPSYL